MKDLYEEMKSEALKIDFARRQNARFWMVCLLFCASSYDFSIGNMPHPNFQLCKSAADTLYRLILDESQHRRRGDEQFIREINANMSLNHQPNISRLAEEIEKDYEAAKQIYYSVAADVKNLAKTI